MLKTLTKYDYREMFCKALRVTLLEQCFMAFSDDVDLEGLEEPNTKAATACAIGVGVAAGIFSGPNIYHDHVPDSVYGRIGLDADIITDLNDHKHTFEDIAKWIEAQP